MTQPIPIHLGAEDDLSEAVLRKILIESRRPFAVGTCYNRGGYGYIRKTIRGLNNAAKGTPFLVLTDLDKVQCPPELIRAWLPEPMHANLMFRVAVREVEAWLLADRRAFAGFLGIKQVLIPGNVDSIEDPKKCLIELAKRSLRKDLRQDIVPPAGSTRQIGPNYNGRLAFFVHQFWNVAEAGRASPSLERAVRAVANFTPSWPR